MPYDDDILNEFAGYFEAKEPGRRERADAWATGIGLQAVDGLKPSKFLIRTARRHIEGKITQEEARRILRDYYEAKDERNHPDPECEECDRASERIAAIINESGFAFSPEYLKSVHRKLFRGLLKSAGKYRDINIRKHEWVLKDESVIYASKDDIEALVKSDFKDEEVFDYSGLSAETMIPHFVNFISYLWQRHPFREGNTRTIAVFAIKYLRSLGYTVTNNMFKENSWYFRNALVRANYMGLGKNAGRTQAYLVAFFRNLLLGENNERKSRYLLIGCGHEPPQFGRSTHPSCPKSGRAKREALLRGSRPEEAPKGCVSSRVSVKPPRGGQKEVVRKSDLKSGLKSSLNNERLILGAMRENAAVTIPQLMSVTGLSRSGAKKVIDRLRSAGRLRRVGPDKGGHWEVV